MAKYIVHGVGLTESGATLRKNGKPLIRKELVDTKRNSLFKNARTSRQVSRTYANFWKLDPRFKRGQVKVLRVIKKR